MALRAGTSNWALAVVDALVEEDICLLSGEKAQGRDSDSHLTHSGTDVCCFMFALVTVYKNIKKQLQDSERDYSFLKEIIWFWEEKFLGT